MPLTRRSFFKASAWESPRRHSTGDLWLNSTRPLDLNRPGPVRRMISSISTETRIRTDRRRQ